MTRPTVASAPSSNVEPDVVRRRRILRLGVSGGFYLVTGVAAAGAAFAVGSVAAERLDGPVALPPLLAASLIIGIGGAFADRVVAYVLTRCPLLAGRRR